MTHLKTILKWTMTLNFMLFTLFASSAAVEPSVKGVIKGQVKEKGNNVPVEYANVILYTKADSSLVTGTITDAEGKFILEKVPEGNYYVVFDFIGYKKEVKSDVKINASREKVEMEPVFIESDTELLGTVNVKAQKNAVSASLDKKVVNVKQNLTARGGTAADALKNAPSVTTDSDGNILVRGSMDYKVLVNGRPSALEAADVLKQTPADIIDRIEIITNPSVKYSAEGTAGIINIILKSELARGFNGKLSATVGTRDKYSSNANFNINTEKLRLSAGAEWRDFKNYVDNNFERFIENGDSTNYGFIYQDRVHSRENLGFRLGADYSLSEKTSLSYSANTGYTSFGVNMDHNTHGYTVPGENDEYTTSYFGIKMKPSFFTNSFNWAQTLNDKGSSLSFNSYYSYISYEFYNYHHMWETDEFYNATENTPYMQHVDNNNHSNDFRNDLDFTHPVSENTKLETGLSYHTYKRFIDVDFNDFNHEINDWEIDPTFTNEFNFREDIYSAYAMVSSKLKDIAYNVGFRAEYMDRELNQLTNTKKYPYSKWHLFPSFSASRELPNKQNLQMSYSHRINRPDEYMMNPFPEAEDNFFYSAGNPFLVPEISHALELGYQKYIEKGVLSAQAYFKQTNDKIGQTMTLMDDDRIYLIMENNSLDQTLGMDLMTNYQLTKWWSLNANTSMFNYYIEGEIEGQEIEKNAFQWNARLVSSFNFNTNTSVQLIGFYNSKTLRIQGEIGDIYMMDVAVNQTFLDGNLSLNLQFKDILQSMNYELYTEQDNLKLYGHFINESPVVMFSISYAFNNYKKMTKDVQTEFDMGM